MLQPAFPHFTETLSNAICVGLIHTDLPPVWLGLDSDRLCDSFFSQRGATVFFRRTIAESIPAQLSAVPFLSNDSHSLVLLSLCFSCYYSAAQRFNLVCMPAHLKAHKPMLSFFCYAFLDKCGSEVCVGKASVKVGICCAQG